MFQAISPKFRNCSKITCTVMATNQIIFFLWVESVFPNNNVLDHSQYSGLPILPCFPLIKKRIKVITNIKTLMFLNPSSRF